MFRGVVSTVFAIRSEFCTIWVYHDPDSVAASETLEKVALTCGVDGDSLISLLAHRRQAVVSR